MKQAIFLIGILILSPFSHAMFSEEEEVSIPQTVKLRDGSASDLSLSRIYRINTGVGTSYMRVQQNPHEVKREEMKGDFDPYDFLFRLQPAGENAYHIQSVKTGFVLECDQDKNVKMLEKNEGAGQKFTFSVWKPRFLRMNNLQYQEEVISSPEEGSSYVLGKNDIVARMSFVFYPLGESESLPLILARKVGSSLARQMRALALRLESLEEENRGLRCDLDAMRSREGNVAAQVLADQRRRMAERLFSSEEGRP